MLISNMTPNLRFFIFTQNCHFELFNLSFPSITFLDTDRIEAWKISLKQGVNKQEYSADSQPRIQTCQPIINKSLIKILKNLPQNGEKWSPNGINLHKAIYVNFQKTKLFSSTQGLFKWNFICWITQKLGHLF